MLPALSGRRRGSLRFFVHDILRRDRRSELPHGLADEIRRYDRGLHVTRYDLLNHEIEQRKAMASVRIS